MPPEQEKLSDDVANGNDAVAPAPTSTEASTPQETVTKPAPDSKETAPAATLENLADAYDIGDSAFDPVADMPIEDQVKQAPTGAQPPATDKGEPGATTPAAPLRDPKTNRFVSPESDRGKELLAAQQTQQPAAKHPAALVRVAREAGFSDEEIAEASTDLLSRLVGRTPPPAPAAPAAEEPTVPAEEAIDWGKDPATGEPITDEDIQPGIVAAFKAQRKLLNELQATVQQLHQGEQQRQAQTVTQRCDAAFAALGDAFEPIFGKGNRDAFGDESDEFARRSAVLAEVQRMGQAGTRGTLEQLIDRAAKRLYPQITPAAPAPKKPAAANGDPAAVDRWNRGTITRPTRRAAAEEKGEASAVRKVGAMVREQGVSDDAADETAGFPE